MTHKREDNEQHFRDFKEALKPLLEAGKLGCVLAQFPTSFRNRDENRDYLAILGRVLAKSRLVERTIRQTDVRLSHAVHSSLAWK